MNEDIESVKVIDIPKYRDSRGCLSVIEADHLVPFQIKRIYYIHETTNESARGAHAHKDLKQLIFAAHGSFRLLLNDGKNEYDILLDNPNIGVLIMRPTWRELYDFSSDAVCMVAASEHFDKSDYIHDMQLFLNSTNGEN